MDERVEDIYRISKPARFCTPPLVTVWSIAPSPILGRAVSGYVISNE